MPLMNSHQNNETRDGEAALLARCREGIRDAYAELLRLYRDKAVNLAYGLLQSRADAEDVAQEAFIRAFRHLSDFRGESAFSSWLYRIVVNVSMEILRKPSRKEIICDDSPSVEDRGFDSLEDRMGIEQILALMPIHLRTVLVLREIDQLSYDEIGHILGIPVGTVRSRLSAARELFRRKYKELMKDEM